MSLDTHGSFNKRGRARSWIFDGLEKLMSNTPFKRSGLLIQASEMVRYMEGGLPTVQALQNS